jgi:hypothetical protein
MKLLLLTTAALEAGAGLALLCLPSVFAQVLLAAPLEGTVALTVARTGGMGLLTLGVAAWFASQDSQSRAARGLAMAMILYNTGAVLILGAAGLGPSPSGICLWPVVVLHAAMAVWCAVQFFRSTHIIRFP